MIAPKEQIILSTLPGEKEEEKTIIGNKDTAQAGTVVYGSRRYEYKIPGSHPDHPDIVEIVAHHDEEHTVEFNIRTYDPAVLQGLPSRKVPSFIGKVMKAVEKYENQVIGYENAGPLDPVQQKKKEIVQHCLERLRQLKGRERSIAPNDTVAQELLRNEVIELLEDLRGLNRLASSTIATGYGSLNREFYRAMAKVAIEHKFHYLADETRANQGDYSGRTDVDEKLEAKEEKEEKDKEVKFPTENNNHLLIKNQSIRQIFIDHGIRNTSVKFVKRINAYFAADTKEPYQFNEEALRQLLSYDKKGKSPDQEQDSVLNKQLRDKIIAKIRLAYDIANPKSELRKALASCVGQDLSAVNMAKREQLAKVLKQYQFDPGFIESVRLGTADLSALNQQIGDPKYNLVLAHQQLFDTPELKPANPRCVVWSSNYHIGDDRDDLDVAMRRYAHNRGLGVSSTAIGSRIARLVTFLDETGIEMHVAADHLAHPPQREQKDDKQIGDVTETSFTANYEFKGLEAKYNDTYALINAIKDSSGLAAVNQCFLQEVPAADEKPKSLRETLAVAMKALTSQAVGYYVILAHPQGNGREILLLKTKVAPAEFQQFQYQKSPDGSIQIIPTDIDLFTLTAVSRRHFHWWNKFQVRLTIFINGLRPAVLAMVDRVSNFFASIPKVLTQHVDEGHVDDEHLKFWLKILQGGEHKVSDDDILKLDTNLVISPPFTDAEIEQIKAALQMINLNDLILNPQTQLIDYATDEKLNEAIRDKIHVQIKDIVKTLRPKKFADNAFWSLIQRASFTEQSLIFQATKQRYQEQRQHYEKCLTGKLNLPQMLKNAGILRDGRTIEQFHNDLLKQLESEGIVFAQPDHAGFKFEFTNPVYGGLWVVKEFGNFFRHYSEENEFVGSLALAAYAYGAAAVLTPVLLSKMLTTMHLKGLITGIKPVQEMSTYLAAGPHGQAIAGGFTLWKGVIVAGNLDEFFQEAIKIFKDNPAELLVITSLALALGYGLCEFIKPLGDELGSFKAYGWLLAGAKGGAGIADAIYRPGDDFISRSIIWALRIPTTFFHLIFEPLIENMRYSKHAWLRNWLKGISMLWPSSFWPGVIWPSRALNWLIPQSPLRYGWGLVWLMPLWDVVKTGIFLILFAVSSVVTLGLFLLHTGGSAILSLLAMIPAALVANFKIPPERLLDKENLHKVNALIRFGNLPSVSSFINSPVLKYPVALLIDIPWTIIKYFVFAIGVIGSNIGRAWSNYKDEYSESFATEYLGTSKVNAILKYGANGEFYFPKLLKGIGTLFSKIGWWHFVPIFWPLIPIYIAAAIVGIVGTIIEPFIKFASILVGGLIQNHVNWEPWEKAAKHFAKTVGEFLAGSLAALTFLARLFVNEFPAFVHIVYRGIVVKFPAITFGTIGDPKQLADLLIKVANPWERPFYNFYKGLRFNPNYTNPFAAGWWNAFFLIPAIAVTAFNLVLFTTDILSFAFRSTAFLVDFFVLRIGFGILGGLIKLIDAVIINPQYGTVAGLFGASKETVDKANQFGRDYGFFLPFVNGWFWRGLSDGWNKAGDAIDRFFGWIKRGCLSLFNRADTVAIHAGFDAKEIYPDLELTAQGDIPSTPKQQIQRDLSPLQFASVTGSSTTGYLLQGHLAQPPVAVAAEDKQQEASVSGRGGADTTHSGSASFTDPEQSISVAREDSKLHRDHASARVLAESRSGVYNLPQDHDDGPAERTDSAADVSAGQQKVPGHQ